MISLKQIAEGVTQHEGIIEIWLGALSHLTALRGRSVLHREFGGLRWGAGHVTSESPFQGKMALQFGPNSMQPEIAAVFRRVLSENAMRHVVYCSHGESRSGLFGRSYIMIPETPFKTVWSPEVPDIYAVCSALQKEGRLDEFPYSTYRDAWPEGAVREVLVDTAAYWLIDPRHDILKYSAWKTGVGEIGTYDQLETVLRHALKPYREKYTQLDWSGIDTPGDPDI